MTGRKLHGSTVTVFGAGGFIGANVCTALSAAGAEIRGFGRPSKFLDLNTPTRWFEAEFGDVSAMRDAVDGADFVVHLLGGSNPGLYNSSPTHEILGNTIPSLELLKTCQAAGVNRIIFLSSGGTVYGPGVATPTDENASTNPISAYGIGKLTVEKYLGLFHHLFGLDYRILRVSNPYGPFQAPERGQGFVAHAMQRAIDNEPIQIWGDGKVIRDYVYIADVADAIVKSILHVGDHKVFNIGSNKGLTLLDVVYSIERTLNVPTKLEFHDARPADIPVSILDINRARIGMGWKPSTDWFVALKMTRDWLLSYRSLK